MRILLWHVHGSWTDAFVHGSHDYLIPALPEGGPWGLGRGGRNWPSNVIDVAPASLRDGSAGRIDAVVLQRTDELAETQRLTGLVPGRDIPAVFVEHNTPRGDVPDTVHPLAGQQEIPVVHVTHFNNMMWDNKQSDTRVIEHGIRDPGLRYTGEIERAAVVGNEPVRRWRTTGTDLLGPLTSAVPVDFFGMGADELPHVLGLTRDRLQVHGDLSRAQLHTAIARRRVYLHPVRWTSLGLSLLEAMHVGMPVVALGTTEVSRAVPADAGTVTTDPAELAAAAAHYLADPEAASDAGKAARAAALENYSLARFLADWDDLLAELVLTGRPGG